MKKFFYIKNYGCQMNIVDSKIITSILLKNGFSLSENIRKSNIILLNSCSIRKNAETTIENKLKSLNFLKKRGIIVGIIGCFSKKFGKYLLCNDKVDFCINPDNYKKLPKIISSFFLLRKDNNTNKNSLLITEKNKETYEDISIFIKKKEIKSFLTIMKGCNNMCTFCIVPFTRGREISYSLYSIKNKFKRLLKNGCKEVILLGQNVNSYKWIDYKKKDFIVDFSNLLDILAREFPNIRIRYSTSNPHDMSDNVLHVMSKHKNICKHIHLPVQSGSNKILKMMNRKYSIEEYLFLIKKIRKIIPDCSISHDIITGFCNEDEKDHLDTIDLMNEVKYNYGYMFSYSPRPGSYAYRKFVDNVPNSVKKRRLQEIINLQHKHSLYRMEKYLGCVQEVLIEGISKKDNNYYYGRNTQNLIVVFFAKKNSKIGDIVFVKIEKTTKNTLIGSIQ